VQLVTEVQTNRINVVRRSRVVCAQPQNRSRRTAGWRPHDHDASRRARTAGWRPHEASRRASSSRGRNHSRIEYCASRDGRGVEAARTSPTGASSPGALGLTLTLTLHPLTLTRGLYVYKTHPHTTEHKHTLLTHDLLLYASSQRHMVIVIIIIKHYRHIVQCANTRNGFQSIRRHSPRRFTHTKVAHAACRSNISTPHAQLIIHRQKTVDI